MSNTLRKSLILSAICLPLIACNTAPLPPSEISVPITTSSWQTLLSGKEGTAVILFSLPQTARADVDLLDGKSPNSHIAVARVRMSNYNCTTGHAVSLSAFNDYEEDIYYFQHEATWNTTHRLTLSWNANNLISAQLNDEKINVSVGGHAMQLRITSNDAPITLQKIEFTSR